MRILSKGALGVSFNNKRSLIFICLTAVCLLSVAAAFSVRSEGTTASTTEAEVRRYHVCMSEYGADNIETQYAEMGMNETILLDADDIAEYYQWQVFIPEKSTWADIYNDNEPECKLYYAKLSNMLDNDGCAILRLISESKNVKYESERFKVTVDSQKTVLSAAHPSASPTSSEQNKRASTREADVCSVNISFLYEDGTDVFQNISEQYQQGNNVDRNMTLMPITGYTPIIQEVKGTDNGNVIINDDI